MWWAIILGGISVLVGVISGIKEKSLFDGIFSFVMSLAVSFFIFSALYVGVGSNITKNIERDVKSSETIGLYTFENGAYILAINEDHDLQYYYVVYNTHSRSVKHVDADYTQIKFSGEAPSITITTFWVDNDDLKKWWHCEETTEYTITVPNESYIRYDLDIK